MQLTGDDKMLVTSCRMEEANKTIFSVQVRLLVSFKFWRYTRPTGLGHLAESGQKLMHLYYF